MMDSPVYWHPWLYELSLRVLYRRFYSERVRAVSGLIADGCTVVDVCAGDCALYRYELKSRPVFYQALDINPRFVDWAKRQSIEVRRFDLRTENIPQADCVVFMGSLYQFLPHASEIVEKLLQAAVQQVIISEPVHNLAQSRFGGFQQLAQFLTRLDGQSYPQRFCEPSLRDLLTPFGFHDFHSLAGGREMVACWRRETQ